jgi:hypothetical protein
MDFIPRRWVMIDIRLLFFEMGGGASLFKNKIII